MSVDEFTLDSANSDPRGIDENTLNDVSGSIFVVDVNGGDAGKVFQYSRENSGPYVHSSTSSRVFDLHDDNENPTGLFFNSFSMSVADDEDDKIYAYEDRHYLDRGWVNVLGKEINGLGRLGNNDPAGVWVDYRWVYVVDSVTKKIYGYNYPDIPFDPIAISGYSSIQAMENSTTTGVLYEAIDPNERYYENATTSWANLGIHRTQTDDRLFAFEKVRDISSTTAEFELVFREPGADYEKAIDSDGNNDYELLISGSGRGFPYAYFPLTVHITDQEPEPRFFWENSTTRQVLEDTPAGQPIYPAVEAINPDNDAVHIYSLKGDDAADFTISASTGLLSINKKLLFAETPYSVIVGIRDGVDPTGTTTTSTEDDDTIKVTINVFRGPVVTGTSSIDYTENGTGDVAQYSATNPGNDTIVWSLQGDDADDFVIHENNGTLLFGAPPDYEDATDSNSDNVYNVAVVASDGSVEGELDVTVTVTNVNEKPEFTEGSSTSRNVDEGDQADRPVGNPVTATDQDASDTLIYSLSGTDSSSFDIDSSTGQIKTKDALDFDGGQKTYEVTVEVRDSRDADGNSDTDTDDSIDVTINVQGVNDPPVLTGTSTFNYLENGRDPVGTFTATDPEGQNIIGACQVTTRTRSRLLAVCSSL
ncbi:MAG: cadherin repeat domain-containing protein [Dehalococcoidia bacterium]|nr:cadherin repeat domain-containing protein [Dehalococcoidia bacterium]